MNRKVTNSMKLIVLVAILIGASTQAQERTSHVEGWEFAVAPYLWMAGMDGDVTVKGTKAAVDADFGDILDNLDTGAQGYFEARNGKWGVYGDFMYIKVANDAKVGAVSIDVESSTTMAEGGVLCRIFEGYGAQGSPVGTDIFIGGRYMNLDAELDFAAAPDVSSDRNWWDPIIGVAYSHDFSEDWLLKATADIGGFGIGSDLTWGLRLLGGYRLGKHANLWFGYRYLDIDYDEGNGANKFEYDVEMHGPILGASFHF